MTRTRGDSFDEGHSAGQYVHLRPSNSTINFMGDGDARESQNDTSECDRAPEDCSDSRRRRFLSSGISSEVKGNPSSMNARGAAAYSTPTQVTESHHRVPGNHIFHTESADPSSEAQTYPPQYQPIASSSTLRLEDYPLQPPRLFNDARFEGEEGVPDMHISSTKFPGSCDHGAEEKEVAATNERKAGNWVIGRMEYENRAQTRPSVRVRLPNDTDFREESATSSLYNQQESGPAAHSSGFTSLAGTDEEDSDDDYDWSGEDDLVDQEAKFERIGQKEEKKGWGMKRIATLLFSSLIGSTLLAALVLLPALLVHLYWYKRNPTEYRRYVNQNVQAWLFWAASNLVLSWALAMVIDIVPILVRYFLSATWGHVSEHVKSRLEMYASVKDTAKPAFYAASGLASWVIIFKLIYGLYDGGGGKNRAEYTSRLYQVVLFFFFLVLVLCAQKMLSHAIAWNFHRTAYKERIGDVQKTLAVIEILRQSRTKTRHQPKWSSSSRQTSAGAYASPDSRDPQNPPTDALRTSTPPLSRLGGAVKLSTTTHAAADHGHDGDGEGVDKSFCRRMALPHGAARVKDSNDGESKERKKHPWFKYSKVLASSPDNEEADRPNEVVLENATRGSTTTLVSDDQKEMEEIPLDILPTVHSGNPAYRSRPMTPTKFNPRHQHLPSTDSQQFRSSNPSRRPSFDKHRHHQRMATNDGADTLVQAAKVLKDAVMHDARNIKGKNHTFSGLAWNVSSSTEAKRLARSIYLRLKDRRRKYLVAADFYPAFPSQSKAEAAFHVFDTDNNGDLSRAEIKTTVIKTYTERHFLSRSMKDVGEALITLDRILLVFALLIVFFVSLSVFGVQVGDSISSIYSLGVAASFIFKSSASRAFDAIMFLFVTHPYDTGDRVFVDEENLVVKKVGLFATVFARSDGTETYYFNSQLFSKFITNVRRSGKTTENLTMQVAWKTPLTKLDALEKCLNEWLSTEDNRWFEPQTGVTLQHIAYQRYLELTIGIAHNGNWQDWGLRNNRRTAFHAAVQHYCRQLGITGYEAPLPIVFGETNMQSTSFLNDQYDDGTTGPAHSAPLTPASHAPKALLGFLPPLSTRSSHLARARKSGRSRKANLGAMNAEC